MKAIIGVDIGTYSVKCAIVKKIKDAYVIRKKEEYVLTGKGKLQKELGRILHAFTRKHKVHLPVFCFSLPYITPRMTARILNVPRLAPKEMKKSMHYEVESRLMFQEMDEVDYGWDIVRETEDECQVMAITLEKAIVEEIMAAQRHLGWSTACIEPQVISFGRLIGQESCAIIDFGHDGTRVMIYQNGIPLAVQSVDIGGKHLTREIEEAIKTGRLKVEHGERVLDPVEEKHQYGAVLQGLEGIENDPRILQAANVIAKQVETLCGEVKQILRAFEVKEEVNIETMYYVGGGAKLKYLVDYFQTELERSLVPLCPTAEGEENDEDYLFTAAVGSWAYRNHPYMRGINFVGRPPKIKFKPEKALAVVLGFLLVAQVGLYDMHQRTDERLNELHSSRSAVEQRRDQIERQARIIQQEIYRYRDLSALVGAVDDVKMWASDILYDLPPRTPVGVQVNQIEMTNQVPHIVIGGKAYSYSDIGFFAIKLEELGQVELKQITEDGDLYAFKLELIPDPGEKV